MLHLTSSGADTGFFLDWGANFLTIPFPSGSQLGGGGWGSYFMVLKVSFGQNHSAPPPCISPLTSSCNPPGARVETLQGYKPCKTPLLSLLFFACQSVLPLWCLLFACKKGAFLSKAIIITLFARRQSFSFCTLVFFYAHKAETVLE